MVLVQLVSRAREKQCLDRLGRRAEEGHESRIPGGVDDAPVLDSDCVDPMHRLDHRTAARGYPERIHEAETTCLNSQK